MLHRRRPRRWLPYLALAVGVVAVIAGAAAWHDVSTARADLRAARSALLAVADDPASLRTGAGRHAAIVEAHRARARVAAAARRLERSLPLRAAGLLPGVATQRRGALALAADARAGATAAARLLTAVDTLGEQAQVRQATAPLNALGRLQGEVERAAEELAGATGPGRGLWGSLADARREVNRTAADAAARLRRASDAMGATRAFLGAGGRRRHLLALQNNAEMRDQGMVLSYAFLVADGGRLTVEGSGPITDLDLDRPIAQPVPPGMQRIFGGLAPARMWQSVNATADFAWSGRAMAEMARQATGDPVDGVVALDVPGLAALLRVVGPVTVPDIATPLDAGNAADVLLNRLYADFPRSRDQAERKERLGAVAEAVVERLSAGSFDAVALGSELGAAAAGGHLRLWSAEGAEQATFEDTGLAGLPAARSPERTVHVSVQNATATKLDYFVKPELELRVAVTPSGTAVVDAEVLVVNDAPTDAPPSYQFGPDGLSQNRPGQYVARVYFWGPRGADQPDSVAESGLRLNQGPVTVDPGGRGSVRFQTVIPRAVRGGRLELRLVPQPRVAPMALRVAVTAPGWEVDAPRTRRLTWDRTLTVSWTLRR